MIGTIRWEVVDSEARGVECRVFHLGQIGKQDVGLFTRRIADKAKCAAKRSPAQQYWGCGREFLDKTSYEPSSSLQQWCTFRHPQCTGRHFSGSTPRPRTSPAQYNQPYSGLHFPEVGNFRQKKHNVDLVAAFRKPA